MASPETVGESSGFAARLRELRQAQGLSQRELARRVAVQLRSGNRRGFDFTYLSKLENARLPPPSAAAVRALASALASDPDELLAMAGKPSPELLVALARDDRLRGLVRHLADHELDSEQWSQLQRFLDGMALRPRFTEGAGNRPCPRR